MDPFIAEIVMFGGNFAPRSWAFCDGQLLPISQNTALFSLIGTIYGGDGRTTFALPDMRGRVPIHPGTGPGLSTYKLGQRSGTETVTLNELQMPQHNHQASTANLTASATPEYSIDPGLNEVPAEGNVPAMANYQDGLTTQQVKAFRAPENLVAGAPLPVAIGGQVAVGMAGASQAHTNIQPYLAVNFIICMFGTFPSRN